MLLPIPAINIALLRWAGLNKSEAHHEGRPRRAARTLYFQLSVPQEGRVTSSRSDTESPVDPGMSCIATDRNNTSSTRDQIFPSSRG